MHLSCLSELIYYAAEREAERDIMPLWLANFILQSIKGQEPISFDDFLNSVKPGAAQKTKNARTAEQITSDIMPFIEADRRRAREGGEHNG